VTEPMITCVTSGATAVPAGASFLSLVISWSSLTLGALRTIAFLDGSPRRRATAPETTASTPPMPTVPNPATASFIDRAPSTRTGLVRLSRSWWPIV
jgi:hypothetical protein